jgi:hypothetical protein
MSRDEQYDRHMALAQGCCYGVYRYLLRGFGKLAEGQQQAALLSAAGVRLVLELQLLAAAEHQRQQQQQTPGQGDVRRAVPLLSSSTRLLHTLIRAVAQASGSCPPPEVLHQAGLPLLQALAAPLQQVQLYSCSYFARYAAVLSNVGVVGRMGEACNALMTAACGPAPVNGELSACHIGNGGTSAGLMLRCALPCCNTSIECAAA